MTISVTCANGHKLKAKDNHAGRTLACPACGSKVVVPMPPANPPAGLEPLDNVNLESPLSGGDDFFSAAETGAPSAAFPQQPQASLARPAAKKAAPAPAKGRGNLTVYLLVGGAVGGSVLALLLIMVVWLAFGRGGGEEVANVGVADASQPADAAPSVAGQTPRAAGQTPAAAPAAQEPPPATSQPAAQRTAPTEDISGIQTKLRQIGLAFHNFHDTYRQFALPRIADIKEPNSNPGRGPQPTALSWRVHLLPFLQQGPLYNQFHLDEPWDSPHNKPLLDHMPEVFRIGSVAEPTTRFQVISGPEMLFGSAKPARFRDITDGSSHTILVLVTGPDRAVPWTQPDALTLDPNDPLAALGTLPDRLVMCGLADGASLIVPQDIEPASFLALATPRGNEIVDAGTFRRQFEDRASQVAGQSPTPGAPTSPGSPAAAPTTPQSPAEFQTLIRDRSNKLKQLALAMHNYHDTYRQFPPAKNAKAYDQDGQPLLSWRVHLLPFLDQNPLYQQFKQDEPWDSPHNAALVENMPDIFRDPQDETGGTTSRYVTLTGPDTPFSKPDGPSIRNFTDGTSTTLLIVAAGPDKAVPWTRPADIAFDPNSPVGCLGAISEPGIFYARADGAVKIIKGSIPPELFKAIVTPAGGERLPKEFAEFEVR